MYKYSIDPDCLHLNVFLLKWHVVCIMCAKEVQKKLVSETTVYIVSKKLLTNEDIKSF